MKGLKRSRNDHEADEEEAVGDSDVISEDGDDDDGDEEESGNEGDAVDDGDDGDSDDGGVSVETKRPRLE